MDGLGEVVDVLVMDPAVDVPVGVDLVLPVGDDVRDDDLVVDDEADVAGEDLVGMMFETMILSSMTKPTSRAKTWLQSGTRAGRYTFTPYFFRTASKAPISAMMSFSAG